MLQGTIPADGIPHKFQIVGEDECKRDLSPKFMLGWWLEWAMTMRPERGLMLNTRGKRLILFFVFSWLTCAHAQYELPSEIFARTLLIHSGSEMATAFKFDHDGRMYLVTTRHLGKTLPPRNAVVQVWHGSWVDLQTTHTIFPAAKDVDLAILEVGEKIGGPYKVVPSSGVLTTGQKVWYMGWSIPGPV